jgi:hypothetical protein
MYPFEREMKILKGYVRNRYRPEGSIVEGYIAEEVIDFCTDFLSDTTTIGLPKSLHEGKVEGKGLQGLQVVPVIHAERNQAHFYILQNLEEVLPYVDEHKTLLRNQNRGRLESWVQAEHNRTFITWFEKRVSVQLKEDPNSISVTIRWLAARPNVNVLSYRSYDINGYCFYTKNQDDKSTMQNSGVTLVAQALHVSSSKDKNPIYVDMAYYGVIENIWELDYVQFRIPVFRCKWIDNNNGVRVDELGFTLVDLSREGHKGELFILASQAKQDFYVTDPENKKWSIVLQGKKHVLGYHNEDGNNNEIEEIPSFSSGVQPIDVEENDVLEDVYIRDDHAEGIWVENASRKKRILKVIVFIKLFIKLFILLFIFRYK